MIGWLLPGWFVSCLVACFLVYLSGRWYYSSDLEREHAKMLRREAGVTRRRRLRRR